MQDGPGSHSPLGAAPSIFWEAKMRLTSPWPTFHVLPPLAQTLTPSTSQASCMSLPSRAPTHQIPQLVVQGTPSHLPLPNSLLIPQGSRLPLVPVLVAPPGPSPQRLQPPHWTLGSS